MCAPGADVPGESAFKQRMEASGGQPTVQGRIDERRKILWVEHLARNRDNGFPGSELFCSQRRLGVAANQVKNLLPLWIGDGKTPRMAEVRW